MIYGGIDAGSRSIKVVLIDDHQQVLETGIRDQGIQQTELAHSLYNEVLHKVGLSTEDVVYTVATGYGRDALDFANTTITEITCHARGVHHLVSEVRTIIDIGGQDSKLIRLDHDGRVRDFVMNDRCAAGTGRFLEVVAQRLEIALESLGQYGQKANKPATISSMCVVFAETEIIGLLASGESRENIIAGVEKSIASRIASMAGRNINDPILFTGGVALIPGMNQVLTEALNRPVANVETPQMTGALGAALLAVKQHRIL
jgi:predicted CoA-substrate-specific enzyme activase